MSDASDGTAAAALNRLVRTVAQLHGRRGQAFVAGQAADGTVRIDGPAGSRVYAEAGWMSQFTRDLLEGAFDAPRSPSRP
jgi:hypothetical protein